MTFPLKPTSGDLLSVQTKLIQTLPPSDDYGKRSQAPWTLQSDNRVGIRHPDLSTSVIEEVMAPYMAKVGHYIDLAGLQESQHYLMRSAGSIEHSLQVIAQPMLQRFGLGETFDSDGYTVRPAASQTLGTQTLPVAEVPTVPAWVVSITLAGKSQQVAAHLSPNPYLDHFDPNLPSWAMPVALFPQDFADALLDHINAGGSNYTYGDPTPTEPRIDTLAFYGSSGEFAPLEIWIRWDQTNHSGAKDFNNAMLLANTYANTKEVILDPSDMTSRTVIQRLFNGTFALPHTQADYQDAGGIVKSQTHLADIMTLPSTHKPAPNITTWESEILLSPHYEYAVGVFLIDKSAADTFIACTMYTQLNIVEPQTYDPRR